MHNGTTVLTQDLMVLFDGAQPQKRSEAPPTEPEPSAWTDPAVQFVWTFSVVMAMAVVVTTWI